MTYLRWVIWALLGVLVPLAMAACGGDDDTPSQTATTVPSGLTREQAEQQAGLTLLIPSYLPAKVNPDPQYIVYARDRGVDVRYSPAGDGREAESPTIYVHEQKGGNLVPNVSPIAETIAGTSVLVSEVTSEDPILGATADVTGVWEQGELKLSVEVFWGTGTDPVELTDEMRTIARRVIESMISPEPSP